MARGPRQGHLLRRQPAGGEEVGAGDRRHPRRLIVPGRGGGRIPERHHQLARLAAGHVRVRTGLVDEVQADHAHAVLPGRRGHVELETGRGRAAGREGVGTDGLVVQWRLVVLGRPGLVPVGLVGLGGLVGREPGGRRLGGRLPGGHRRRYPHTQGNGQRTRRTDRSGYRSATVAWAAVFHETPLLVSDHRTGDRLPHTVPPQRPTDPRTRDALVVTSRTGCRARSRPDDPPALHGPGRAPVVRLECTCHVEALGGSEGGNGATSLLTEPPQNAAPQGPVR